MLHAIYPLCVLLVWPLPLGGVAAACTFLHSSNVDDALSIAYWDAVLIFWICLIEEEICT